MSTNDQLFATILLASGLLMTPDHRDQLTALSKGISTPAKSAEVVVQASVPPPVETKAKKIKPRSTAAAASVSLSLPPVPTNSSASDFLVPVDMAPITIVTTIPAPVTTAAVTPDAVTTAAVTTAAVTTAANATIAIPQNSASNASYPNDALRTHRYRIAVPDPKFCMARRWNEDAPIPGTETSAETSKGKIYPEQQCTRFPVQGTKICATCVKAEQAYMSNPESPPVAAKRWRGRLDGPMFANAPFLGSDLFWKKYPQGLPGDSTTAAPADWLSANATKAKPKAKAATAAVITTAPVTTAPATTPSSNSAAGAVTSAVPVKTKNPADEWVLALVGDCSYIYERATMKCYEADMSITSSTKDMARLDRYAGKYEPATNNVNIYGSESDEE